MIFRTPNEAELAVFLDHIHTLCVTHYNNHEIRTAIYDKCTKEGQSHIRILAGYRNEVPVVFAIIEKTTPSYGNIILHVIDEQDTDSILSVCNVVIAAPECKNSYLELIQYYPNNPFKPVFVSRGIFELRRKRLVRYLSDPIVYPSWPEGLSLRPVDADVFDVVGQISSAGHRQSQDYPNYPDLEDETSRQALEAAVFGERYGPVIRPATLLLLQDTVAVGYISYVGIACWGQAEVPWIFDISVDPEHHGKGYGKQLLQYTLATLRDMRYDMVGLSVTSDNESALALYFKLGFVEVEDFSEFRL